MTLYAKGISSNNDYKFIEEFDSTKSSGYLLSSGQFGYVWTTTAAYNLKRLRLNVNAASQPGSTLVEIYATDGGSGLPTGSPLVSETVSVPNVSLTDLNAYMEIVLTTPVALSANTKYAVRVDTTGTVNQVGYPNSNPNGYMCRTLDGGTTWALYGSYEWNYEMYSDETVVNMNDKVVLSQDLEVRSTNTVNIGSNDSPVNEIDATLVDSSIVAMDTLRSSTGSSIAIKTETSGQRLYISDGSLPTSSNIYNSNWVAQTFTATDNYKITSVMVRGGGTYASSGDVTVSLRATLAGVPTGSDLVYGTKAASSWGNSWQEITLTPYQLTKGTLYAVVVHNPNAYEQRIVVRGANYNLYSGGTGCSSSDGSSWSISGNEYPIQTYGYFTDSLLEVDPASGEITARGGAAFPVAWGSLNMSSGTPTLLKGYNIDSLSDNGVGDVIVNLSVTMADTSYCVVASCNEAGPARVPGGAFTTTSFRIICYDGPGTSTVDSSYVSFVVYGDLA